MSYRILVQADAADALRTLPEHLVRTAGRRLAEVAEQADNSLSADFARMAGGALLRMDLEGCVLLYNIDKLERSVSVVGIEAREEIAASA